MVVAKIMIVTGEGINCQNETAVAFNYFGLETNKIHVQAWIQNPKIIHEHQALVFPGGFSFADELGSGQVMALKLKGQVLEEIIKFYQNGGYILGICNGFQILVKMGLLPLVTGRSQVALAHNRDKKFIDQWVELSVNKNSSCAWTVEVPQKIYLPIRHGEGRLVVPNPESLLPSQMAVTYTQDINGSYLHLAGITDTKGQVLGLMPHPEANFFSLHSPFRRLDESPRELSQGALFFKSLAKALQ